MKHSIGKAFVLGLLFCVSLPVACGDSEKDATPAKGGTGGTGGTGGGAKAGNGSDAGGDGVGEGGMAGAGGGAAELPPGLSGTTKNVKCGTASCDSVGIPLGNLFIDPCCPVDVPNTCGVDTTLLAASSGPFAAICQPVDQAGDVDEGCPSSAGGSIPVMGTMLPVMGFEGCCRADTGTCGVVLDKVASGPITLVEFGLGCVDAAPFFPGETPAACGEGAGGGGGAGGAPGSGGAGGAGVQ